MKEETSPTIYDFERDRKPFTFRKRPKNEQWAVNCAVKILTNVSENDFLNAGIEDRQGIIFEGKCADDVADLILVYYKTTNL